MKRNWEYEPPSETEGTKKKGKEQREWKESLKKVISDMINNTNKNTCVTSSPVAISTIVLLLLLVLLLIS